MKIAKIFESDRFGQILVRKINEDDGAAIEISFYSEEFDCGIAGKMTFKNIDSAYGDDLEKLFEPIDLNQVEKFAIAISSDFLETLE